SSAPARRAITRSATSLCELMNRTRAAEPAWRSLRSTVIPSSSWDFPVEEDDVVVHFHRKLQTFAAIGRQIDGEMICLQTFQQDSCDPMIRFNNQNAHTHHTGSPG